MMPKQLEKYLNQLRAQLRTLPSEQREIEIQEISHHLEALIWDYQQAGASEEIAVTQALAQFGSSRANGRDLSQVWDRGKGQQQNLLQKMRAVLVIAWLSLFAYFILGNTVRVSPTATPTMPQNGSTLSAIDQQHQTRIWAVQERLSADNLAIQDMDKRDTAAISKARTTNIRRFQKNIDAANSQWQVKIQAFQHQSFISLVLFPVIGLVLLPILILLSFLVARPRTFTPITTR